MMSEVPANTKKLEKVAFHGWLIILFGFFGFFFWAAIYEIERAVPGNGFVTTAKSNIVLLAPEGGLVTEVRVSPGQIVREGEPVVLFDTRQLLANESSSLAMIDRLKSSENSLRLALASRRQQIDALSEQYKSRENLVERKFVSRSALASMAAERSLANSEALELEARIEQLDIQKANLEKNLSDIRHEISQKKVLAPIDGTVMNLELGGPNVNILPGTPMMTIVPLGNEMIVDARIPVNLGDRVSSGMDVDILFPSLSDTSLFRVKGKLDYLSADKIEDQFSTSSYFQVKIKIVDKSASSNPRLRIGLPATVMVNTGPQTLWSYMTKPLRNKILSGMQ